MIALHCSFPLVFALLWLDQWCHSFAPYKLAGLHRHRHFKVMAKKDWEEDIDRRVAKTAKPGGGGETIAGAVLGGLLLGPFGK